jgi:hypothetical protein
MKVILRIFLLTSIFASILFGTYAARNNVPNSVVICTNTVDRSFDEALMFSLDSLCRSKESNVSNGIIRIDVDGTEIVAKVKVRDLKKLSNGEISTSEFVRKYVDFS